MLSTTGWAWVNGRWLPQAEVCIGLHDAGFVWGATVTDRCRTIRQQLYRWPDHLRRFRQSCLAAQVPLIVDDACLTQIAQEIVARQVAELPAGQEVVLVLLATPGAGEPGPADLAAEAGPTLILYSFPLSFRKYRPLVVEGARLWVPAIRQVPASSVDPHIKQRSRLHWWLAEQQARAHDPGAQALLQDSAGCLTETATANFLLVQHGAVVSPPQATILPGVSLQVVRELCEELHIPFIEKTLHLEDCFTAEEALLTSTPYGVVGVRSIQGQQLPWPGPVLQRLLAAWNRTVGLDLHQQIRDS